MRRVWRFLWRTGLALVLFLALFFVPVGYNELACRGTPSNSDYTALVGADWQRSKSRTLLTYPEWHIVHAYDNYAKVIETGDPHHYAFFREVRGFWSSLCSLSKAAAAHGGFDTPTKQMVYVIGVSFSLELVLKAAYEETLGRVFAMLGGERTPLEDLSAAQARGYADFLTQIPWYRWDFRGDKAALIDQNTGVLRDVERRFALGVEYGVKAAYGDVIAQAVASTGFDELRMRSVVSGLDEATLGSVTGVDVIASIEQGIIIETPRYREFTHIAVELAALGAHFVEIGGNTDILFTALSKGPVEGALANMARQGYSDTRVLTMLPVPELADRLRDGALRIEHIHDY